LKIYIAPKNNKTIPLSKDIPTFYKFIDKYIEDNDCITIDKIDSSLTKEIIIYSPKYLLEIYNEYIQHIEKNKISFYLFPRFKTKSLLIAKIYYTSLLTFLKLQKSFNSLFKKSETSKVRNELNKYCIGNGIDIGFGGDPITKSAITIDLPSPYAKYKKNPHHLKGYGDNLYWFKDNVLDYIYSSHLLEDFEDTEKVLNEWFRVLKKDGVLVLFLPNEQLYRAYNKKIGKEVNHHHIHDNFSLNFIKEIIRNRDDLEIIHEKEPSNIYSFELVIKKVN